MITEKTLDKQHAVLDGILSCVYDINDIAGVLKDFGNEKLSKRLSNTAYQLNGLLNCTKECFNEYFNDSLHSANNHSTEMLLTALNTIKMINDK